MISAPGRFRQFLAKILKWHGVCKQWMHIYFTTNLIKNELRKLGKKITAIMSMDLDEFDRSKAIRDCG